MIDIDGDCFNDLVIFSIDTETKQKKMEIWKGWVNDTIKYCLFENNVKDLDNKIGAVSFADVDRDGFVDLIFPIESINTAPVISVLFNQIDAKVDWSYDYCKERRADSKNLTSIFPDKVLSSGADNLKSQIFIKLVDDNAKSIYSDPSLKLIPLVRVGNFISLT